MVGIEAEWFVQTSDPSEAVSHDRVIAAVSAPFQAGSRLSFEPGGQVELSTRPGYLSETIRRLSVDQQELVLRLQRAGLTMRAAGLDPRDTQRVIDTERYVAMERYFAASWPAGLTMMRRTGAIQINLDIDWDPTTWAALNNLAVVMAAAFSNSPDEGWKSGRLRVWSQTDPSRTAPVPSGGDPLDAWARYACDANVMFIRQEEGLSPLTEPLAMRGWIEGGHQGSWPTLEDIDLHLTTLFPPVRPRGWAEIRVCDALPGRMWVVPAVIAHTAMNDERIRARLASMNDVAGRFEDAARDGLDDPAIAAAAQEVFKAVIDSLDRSNNQDMFDEVVGYYESYVLMGRSPADDAYQKEASWT